jgi:hypothetical protein
MFSQLRPCAVSWHTVSLSGRMAPTSRNGVDVGVHATTNQRTVRVPQCSSRASSAACPPNMHVAQPTSYIETNTHAAPQHNAVTTPPIDAHGQHSHEPCLHPVVTAVSPSILTNGGTQPTSSTAHCRQGGWQHTPPATNEPSVDTDYNNGTGGPAVHANLTFPPYPGRGGLYLCRGQRTHSSGRSLSVRNLRFSRSDFDSRTCRRGALWEIGRNRYARSIIASTASKTTPPHFCDLCNFSKSWQQQSVRLQPFRTRLFSPTHPHEAQAIFTAPRVRPL